jgi:predicted heme/steroid binding protein
MGWTRQEVLDVARSTGRPVVEAWSSHDAGQMGTVVGPMLHHTGSTWSYPASKAPTLKTVREGRSDLQNSLSMYYIDYEGVIYCISEKISWHSGAGYWQGVTDGNGHYAGIEAESDGRQWTPATVDSYKRLAAAILRKAGHSTAYAPRHADYALPKGRKTDFSGLDSAAFLADVSAYIANPNPAPRSGAALVLGDDMPTVLQSASKPPILVVGGLFVELRSKAEQVNALTAYNQGQPVDADGVPSPVWVEDQTLSVLISQSQQAVRGGSTT